MSRHNKGESSHRPRPLAARSTAEPGRQHRMGSHERQRPKVPAARLPGRAAGERTEARPAGGTCAARAGPTAPGRRGSAHAQPDGVARGLSVRALREPPGTAGRRRRALRALRSRSPQLYSVRLLRHQRAVRVFAGGADGASLAERRTEQCTLFAAADDGRATDQHARSDKRAPGVR